MRTLFLLGCCALPLGAAEPDYVRDMVNYRRPELPMAKVVQGFPDGLLDLWLPALERPETETKIQSALAIAKAHQLGLKGTSAAVKPLLRELEREGVASVVRLTVAQTLIALDARTAAPIFLKMVATEDEQFRNLVEPALAKWDHQPARAVWLQRLDEGKYFTLVRSIQCLAHVKETKAVPKLQALVRAAETPAPVRTEAARALGTLAPSGGENDATTLLANKTPQGMSHRVAAALLVHKHDSAAAVKVLQTLANDTEPAVSAIAITRLLELDPKLVPDVPTKRQHTDPKIRELVIDTLHRLPTLENVPLLSDSTNDSHPDVRTKARHALATYAAKPELRAKVLETETALLKAKGDWRGLEQGCLLFVQLKHQPAVRDIFGLLDNPRGEVQIVSAWALRVLDAPAMVPDINTYLNTRMTAMRAAKAEQRLGAAFNARDYQLSQIIQILGAHRHQPASAALHDFIPPGGKGPPFGPEARAAAVWALGMIHEGTPNESLAEKLLARLSAVGPFDVEDERVRWMCAVSLGRMKAKSASDALTTFYADKQITQSHVNNACGWALAQINGTPVPVAGIIEQKSRQWFLVPQR